MPIGNAIFRENFVIFCIFTCQRHIISWAPFDLREKTSLTIHPSDPLTIHPSDATNSAEQAKHYFASSCRPDATVSRGYYDKIWCKSYKLGIAFLVGTALAKVGLPWFVLGLHNTTRGRENIFSGPRSLPNIPPETAGRGRKIRAGAEVLKKIFRPKCGMIFTSKCMHGMDQTEAEYSRHGKRSQRASLSQIGPVVLEV